MAFAFFDATTITRFIINSISVGLRFTQTCIDFPPNGAAGFVNFLLLDRSVTCIKLFISAYRQVHIEGYYGMFAFACLIGMSLHLFTIVIHLSRNHMSRAAAWMCGMAILLAAGAFLLGMEVPDDFAWHNTAVEAILVVFTCIEAALLLLSKLREHGRNENLLRDLFMVSAETLVNIYLCADYLAKTHRPWDGEKVLHLIGCCLAVLIGLCQIFWILYIHRGEAQTNGAATDDAGGVDLEQQMVQQFSQVLEQGDSKTPPPVLLLPSPTPIFIREIEMSARSAIEDGGGVDGEDVPPEEGVELAVAPPD